MILRIAPTASPVIRFDGEPSPQPAPRAPAAVFRFTRDGSPGVDGEDGIDGEGVNNFSTDLRALYILSKG